MPATDFKTIPDEILHIAGTLEDYLGHNGYASRIETRDIGFPFTPTLTASRGHETLIIELSSVLDIARLDRWVKFCRSQSSDTRLCASVTAETAYKEETSLYCQSNRLGLWTFQAGQILELRAPLDLAVQIDLPALKDLPPKLRPYLAEPFRKISSGEWRDGLGDIYLAIEDRAREYLKDGIQRTRIVSLYSRGKPLGVDEVDGMTMGALSTAFSKIRSQNQQDSVIGNTLAMINPTRVKLTHKRLEKAAEAVIRNDVGKHVYAAINCLEEILQ